MNQAQQKFRERLLSQQKAAPSEKYRKGLAELHAKRLSPTQRVILLLVTISTVSAAVFMAWLAAFPPRPFPMLARLGLGFWSVYSLTAGLLASRVIKDGILGRRLDPDRIVAFIFKNLLIFSITMVALMGQVPETGTRVIMGAIALLFFGIGGVFLITARLEQMELRTREKLLEIELELQQVADEARELRH